MSEDWENTQARDRHSAREERENAERAQARERVRAAQEQEKQQRLRRQTASLERAALRMHPVDPTPQPAEGDKG